MKVAVTGASGYLGRLVVGKLDADPRVESVLGLDLNPPEYESTKLEFKRADVVSSDFASLLTGMDSVIHLAFIVDPPKDIPMARIDAINIDGSKRVFEGARRAGIRHIVYSSSIAAYGAHPDNPQLFTEDSPRRPNPDWYYSRAKGRVETFLDEWEMQHPEMVVVRFRPCIFLGPHNNNTFGSVFSKDWLICLGEQTRTNYCWDEDVAEAFRLGLFYHESEVFNIAGDGVLTIDDIGKLTGKKVLHINRRMISPLVWLVCKTRLIAESSWDWFWVGFSGPVAVSSEKAKRMLGWKPRFDSAGAVVEHFRSLGS